MLITVRIFYYLNYNKGLFRLLGQKKLPARRSLGQPVNETFLLLQSFEELTRLECILV